MATGLESRKAPSAEARIERQLADTCRRIRMFDAGASLLLFGSLVWAYTLLFALFDLATDGAEGGWPAAVRWIGYASFLTLTAVLAMRILQRLVWPINPYYAARRLEETVPEAKNSVISWLDLRQTTLPPALRKTIGSKAARDLDEADPEHAVDRAPTRHRLILFGFLTLGMLVLIAARPGQFLSLMQRALLPFLHGRLVEQTRITLLRPEGGDAVVTAKQALHFVVQIDGRVPAVDQPGAPALYYRYQPGDKFVAQPLQPDPDGHWTARLAPDQIGSTGLWYKIAAGDAETPEYQVTVRAQPFVLAYEITYKYRPYLNRPPETVVFPNEHTALPFIKRHQGTEVALVVRTNRPLRQGSVRLAMGKEVKDLPGTVRADDPQAFRTHWVLEKSGEFFVAFTSTEGERYYSRVPFPMDVLVDAAPEVVLTKPAHDVSRPANGTLEIEGTVDDDLGIKRVTLRLEAVEDGKTIALKPQPYRAGSSLDLDGKGMYPWHLDYLDLIKLDELHTADDTPLTLKPKAVVRYWLEAADNSDYPKQDGNVRGSEPKYKITILPPQDEQQQRQARDQALSKQQEHNAQQDKNLTRHKQDRENAAQGKNSPEDKAADNYKEQIQNTLDKHDQPPQSDKGGAKGEEKDHAQNKPGESEAGGAPSPEQKDQKPGDQNQAGNSKDGSQQQGDAQQPGQAKDNGSPKDGKSGSESSGNGPESDPMAGSQKDGPGDGRGKSKDQGDGGAQGPPENSGQGKGADKGGKAPQPQQSQSKGGSETGMDTPSAQTKPGGGKAKDGPDPNQRPQGLAKPEEATGERSLSKEKGPDGLKQSQDPALKNAAKNVPGEEIGRGKAEGKPPSGQAPKEAPGFSKGEEPPAHEAKQQPPTPEQVEQLKELMQRKDGIGDWAKDALEKMTKEAPDPKVRDLAKKALDEAGAKKTPDAEPGGSTDPKTAANTKPPVGPMGDGSQASKSTSGKPPEQGNPAKSGNNTKDPGGTNPGGITGQNPSAGSGPHDNIKPDAVRKDLARFGGNLQLEDFLKRATPAYRAEHGISDAEWQQLLSDAARYDELLRKLQHAKSRIPRDSRGTGTVIGSGLPTQVQRRPGVDDGGDTGRAEPPPELRDAQERLRQPRK